MWRQLVYEFQNLNPYIVIILCLSVIGLVILIEKIFSLAVTQRMNYRRFMVDLKTMLRANDWERAQRYCDEHKKNILAVMGSKSLESFLDKPSEAQHTIEEETAAIIPMVEARLSLLPAIATTILLTGVLATIHGLWDIVYTAQETGGTGGISLLELGLSRCLAPTALALGSCIFLYIGNFLCVSTAERIVGSIQQLGLLLNNYLIPENAATQGTPVIGPEVSDQIAVKESHEEEII